MDLESKLKCAWNEQNNASQEPPHRTGPVPWSMHRIACPVHTDHCGAGTIWGVRIGLTLFTVWCPRNLVWCSWTAHDQK
jgi:hypothetical protein